MKRSALTAALVMGVALLCGMTAAPALAQMTGEVAIMADEHQKPVTDAAYIPDEFDIAIDGEFFFRIRTSAAGYTAAERARIAETRLVHIISFAPTVPEAVHISAIRGKPTIYVGNVRLITVYPNDVEATGAASMHQLASIWADQLAASLRKVAPWPAVHDSQ